MLLYTFFIVIISLFSFFLNAENKKFVVVIPSYNNAAYYQKNLDSVFNQTYSNWRIIYINDASTDNTGQLVENYVKEQGFDDRVIIIHNQIRRLAMANIYVGVHMCRNDEIVFTLDGDDWLIHNEVMTYINEVYKDLNIWITYGNYIDWPISEQDIYEYWITTFNTFGVRPVPPEIVENNDFRTYIGCTGSLRTFYAWLFKRIKIKDLIFEKKFLPMAYNVGIMIPMLEMAGSRFMCIQEILYVHNIENPLNDHKTDCKQLGAIEEYIRKRPKYQPLEHSPLEVGPNQLMNPHTEYLESMHSNLQD